MLARKSLYGGPIKRKGSPIHFHNLGIEKMTDAIMSLESPLMVLCTKSKDGNPTIILMLPVEGNNGAPLYGVMSFYSEKSINGKWDKRPHLVLTIAERNLSESGGRIGWKEMINRAINENRVLDFDKKRREDLSVIANSTRVGNITVSSLEANVAQFRKGVKVFKDNHKISYI